MRNSALPFLSSSVSMGVTYVGVTHIRSREPPVKAAERPRGRLVRSGVTNRNRRRDKSVTTHANCARLASPSLQPEKLHEEINGNGAVRRRSNALGYILQQRHDGDDAAHTSREGLSSEGREQRTHNDRRDR